MTDTVGVFIHAGASDAESLINTLVLRLRETGYRTWTTPFGYFCEWDLGIYGESLAKVWKEIH